MAKLIVSKQRTTATAYTAMWLWIEDQGLLLRFPNQSRQLMICDDVDAQICVNVLIGQAEVDSKSDGQYMCERNTTYEVSVEGLVLPV